MMAPRAANKSSQFSSGLTVTGIRNTFSLHHISTYKGGRGIILKASLQKHFDELKEKKNWLDRLSSDSRESLPLRQLVRFTGQSCQVFPWVWGGDRYWGERVGEGGRGGAQGLGQIVVRRRYN